MSRASQRWDADDAATKESAVESLEEEERVLMHHASSAFKLVDVRALVVVSALLSASTTWESCHLLRAEIRGVANSLAMTRTKNSTARAVEQQHHHSSRVVVVLPSLTVPVLLAHAYKHDKGFDLIKTAVVDIEAQARAASRVRTNLRGGSQAPAIVEMIAQRSCGDVDMERAEALVREQLDDKHRGANCGARHAEAKEANTTRTFRSVLVLDGRSPCRRGHGHLAGSPTQRFDPWTKIRIDDESLLARAVRAAKDVGNLTRYRFVCHCRFDVEPEPQNTRPPPFESKIWSHPLACKGCNASAFVRYRAASTGNYKIVATEQDDRNGTRGYLTAVLGEAPPLSVSGVSPVPTATMAAGEIDVVQRLLFGSFTPIVERFRQYTKGDMRYLIISLALRSLGDLHPVLLSHDIDVWWSLSLHYGSVRTALTSIFEASAAEALWCGIVQGGLSL